MSIRWPVLLTIVVAIVAFIFGLRAAFFWKRASEVPIDPGWDFEPVDESDKQRGWTDDFLLAVAVTEEPEGLR
jgi:hypothetical protein